MSPLRMRMIEDTKLAGLSPGTRATYIDAVRRLAAYYRRSPDQLSEEEVRAYMLNLRERRAARGTFKANYNGIQYLYRYTLNRDCALFSKKHPPAAAEAFAPRARRRRRPPAAWLHNEPDPCSLRPATCPPAPSSPSRPPR
jgi:Phage integrase, N-terminal SAM-like domain